MKQVLFIESFSGVSGDMFLAALLDLGVPIEILHHAWNSLGLKNYEVEVFYTTKCGTRALRCRVKTDESAGPRTWNQYQKVLKKVTPSKLGKNALELCKTLFEIEAEIHGTTLNRLHLHEMGGTDLLLDIVGTLAGIDWLKPDRIVASPINTGHGAIHFSHGTFPIPTPATTRLLADLPVYQDEMEGELTTPTGALLVSRLADSFGRLPALVLHRTGVGAGERDLSGRPNVLRLFLGEEMQVASEGDILLVETNIDDSNPQLLAYFMEKALEAGALDVSFAPVYMKKNRPGVCLSMLLPASLLQPLTQLLFSQTTAIGLRYWPVGRRTLQRRWKTVKVEGNNIRIKESYLGDSVLNYQPEFEDVKQASEKTGRPAKQISADAIHQYLKAK